MSILPSFLKNTTEDKLKKEILPIPHEYGVNFKTGQLTGKIVEGIEAIKVWIWFCLHTERFRHAIYSWDYGTSIEQYIGEILTEEYLSADCRNEITEALLVNPYIESIDNFSVKKRDDSLLIKFKVITRIGKLEVMESVRR